MKFLKSEAATEWCMGRGVDSGARSRQFYPVGGSHRFFIKLEEKPSDTVLLTDYLVPSWEEPAFKGGLLWLTGFGIWGENSEKTGLAMLKQMRSGHGEAGTISDKPALLFEPEEVYEAHSFLLLPILFGWDALWVPDAGGYVVSIGHHGTATVTSQDKHTYDELRLRMKDWSPRESEEDHQSA